MSIRIIIQIFLALSNDTPFIFINDSLNGVGENISLGSISDQIFFGNRKHLDVMQTMMITRTRS